MVDVVTLAYLDRHRRRIRFVGDSGVAFLLDLPRAHHLADGDGLELDSGGYVRVRAAAEPVLDIEAADPAGLLRIAWHLGNRHLPTQIAGKKLRIRRDHVIEDMVRGLGARLVETKSHAIGELSETWTVMRDPEGNGFCIQSPPTVETHYIGNVTFSCAEPVVLGKFWTAALGWPEEEIDKTFLQQLLDAGMDERELTAFYVTREAPKSRPRFLFQRRERSRPASYPIHLDFRTDDREQEVERLSGLGATVEATKNDAGRAWTVMRDPESNPFCVE